MATPVHTIDELIRAENWPEAKRRIEADLVLDPTNHWLVTQLGVVLYESRQYKPALERFQRSLQIVPDCPLTLWNVAGALDALGRHREALDYYVWLLRSRRTAEDDPCWESDEWTAALKTDCVYRAAGCFERLQQPAAAAELYRQYIGLLLRGYEGTYPIQDALRKMRGTQADRPRDRKRWRPADLQEIFSTKELTPQLQKRQALPKLDLGAILAE